MFWLGEGFELRYLVFLVWDGNGIVVEYGWLEFMRVKDGGVGDGDCGRLGVG